MVVEREVEEHVAVVEVVHGQLPSSCDRVFVVCSNRGVQCVVRIRRGDLVFVMEVCGVED